MDQPPRARKPATYADLEALPDNIKGEIIDGVLYTQPRPRARHMRVTCSVIDWLHGPFDRRRDPGGWWILVEPGIEVARAPEFSPDAAGWRWEHMPSLPTGPITTIPDWICEVLSPSNRHYDLTIKRQFYAELGVDHLWYIDPEARSLSVNRLHAQRWVELAVHVGDVRVRVEPFDAIEVDLTDWWTTEAPLPLGV